MRSSCSRADSEGTGVRLKMAKDWTLSLFLLLFYVLLGRPAQGTRIHFGVQDSCLLQCELSDCEAESRSSISWSKLPHLVLFLVSHTHTLARKL